MSAGSTGQAEGPFLLMKRGLYHRPGGKGYTGLKSEAGRWTFAEAVQSAGSETTMRHEDEAPEFAPSCYPEVKEAAFRAQRDAAQARIAELEAELEAIRADRPFIMGFNEGHETALRQAMEAVQDQIDLAKASSLYSPKDRDLANVIGGAEEAIRAIAALLPQPKEPSP